MKRILILIILIILIIPTTTAQFNFMQQDIVINTSKSNTSMTFNSIPVIVDSPIIIRNNAIELWNISYVNGELIFNGTSLVNESKENFYIDSKEFPHLSHGSDVNEKRISSNLSSIVNATITFLVQTEPSKITYTSKSKDYIKEYTKSDWVFDSSGKTITLNLVGIENAQNEVILDNNILDIQYSTQPGGGFGSGLISETVIETFEELGGGTKEVGKNIVGKVVDFIGSLKSIFKFIFVGLFVLLLLLVGKLKRKRKKGERPPKTQINTS